jgi:lipoyl(octanoyl) transferase
MLMSIANKTLPIVIRHLGLCDYSEIFNNMLEHIHLKKACEIWVLEHHPVYTQGRLTKKHHFHYPNNIPIVSTDRGGQLTYHGPFQMIVYPLIQLNFWNISPRELVNILEETTVSILKKRKIKAYGNPDARGVYIDGKKIASIGLKIKQGYVYHGIAINIDMDLTPFKAIVPCGDPDMEMTNLSSHTDIKNFKVDWVQLFVENLDRNRYNTVSL